MSHRLVVVRPSCPNYSSKEPEPSNSCVLDNWRLQRRKISLKQLRNLLGSSSYISSLLRTLFSQFCLTKLYLPCQVLRPARNGMLLCSWHHSPLSGQLLSRSLFWKDACVFVRSITLTGQAKSPMRYFSRAVPGNVGSEGEFPGKARVSDVAGTQVHDKLRLFLWFPDPG